jgi:HNH endonuclease
LAVSKRTRYEVLRRDKYTCRYCGASAPDVLLVIDHVTPRKHGGRDDADNLVTACEPCNAGKSATMPEDWLVREIEKAAREWAASPDYSPDEDDYSDMFAYQDALYYLEALPVSRVIHWIAQVFITAMPYRPMHNELIIAAAAAARNAEAEAQVTGLCRCPGCVSTPPSR